MKRSIYAWLMLFGFIGIAMNYLMGCTQTRITSSHGGTIPLRGRLVATTEGQPVPNASITLLPAEGGSISTTTDANGQFAFSGVSSGSRIDVQRPDSGRNVYRVSISQDVGQVDLDVFINPIFAQPLTQGIDATPPPQNPAGPAFITSPQTGDTVSCNPSASASSLCRSGVEGIADARLGQIGSIYHTYVLVHPTKPSGLSGFFPQFPEVAVDPATGHWVTESQVGPTARPGDEFELTVVVTTVELPRNVSNPTQYDRPIDVPGVVFIAPFVRNLKVGN